MKLKSTMTASLFAAMTSASIAACDSGSDTTAEPTEEQSETETDRLAAPATADPDFLERYAETNRFRLGHPRAIEVLPDGSGVLFLRTGPRSFEGRLWFFDAASGEERELLTASRLLGEDATEELTAEEAARRERMRLSASGIASFRVSPDGSTILVPLSGRLFLVERARLEEGDAIRELPSEAGPAIDPRFSPTGSHIATVRGGDLYVIDVATGAERRLTTRPSEEVTNGLAEFVAQEEMGRMRGFWWAPDGASIAYQQTDTTGMERMHILDPMHPEQQARAWPYPRPGEANAAVRLGVLPIAGGETRWIDWDHDRYPYLASVRWPSAGPLTVLVQDRLQENEALLAADPSSGETRELLTEQDEAWINLDPSTPRWLADGQRFVWASERAGQWRLEMRDGDGGLVRELTDEAFGYRELLAIDEERGLAWVLASDEPTETHVWTVPLSEDGEPVKRSEARGEHDAEIARDGSVWVHTRHLLDGTIESVVRRADGETIGALRSEALEPPFEPNLSYETIGRRDWRAVVIRPRDFDERLRYPVILHVYGGPHARYVTTQPTRYLIDQWHADHNFIVVSIDGRGTPARGREWERTIDGDFIEAPLEDQIEALQQLGDRHPEMDMQRVGVWGWSFGGYFSAMAVLRRPDIFRAAVAGAPVSEWRDYDTHYTERYIGLPEAEGEEGSYRASSVLTYATEAPPEDHRPLLLIHGTADDNVYFSHSLKLQNALFRAGRPVDLLALSGLTHMVPDPTVTSRMHERIMAFFEAHLRGD